MRRIVIIGNSAAGTSAAQSLRSRDKDARISIVTDEPFLAYERYRVLRLLDGSLKERDLTFRSRDFYANFGLDLLTDHKVISVSTHRRRVIVKDRDPLEFDDLVIASGRRVAVPALRGAQKEGVVGLTGLREVKLVMDQMPVAHTVLVVGSDPLAGEVVRILAARRIDVKCFGCPDPAPEGVEAIADNPIIEFLGEGEVRAVRLASHKVIGASLVVFTGPREANADFLKETDIDVNRGVLVDASFRTSVPFVYAVGDVAEPREGACPQGWQEALRQGEALGGYLCQV